MATQQVETELFGRETRFEYSPTAVGYALLLFGLGAFGAGRIAGLDGVLERTATVDRHPALRYLLG